MSSMCLSDIAGAVLLLMLVVVAQLVVVVVLLLLVVLAREDRRGCCCCSRREGKSILASMGWFLSYGMRCDVGWSGFLAAEYEQQEQEDRVLCTVD